MKEEKPKVCANCKNSRYSEFSDDRFMCALRENIFYRYAPMGRALVWIISISNRGSTSCSLWTKLENKHRLAFRLKGVRIPRQYDVHSQYTCTYLGTDGNTYNVKAGELNAKIWRDQNTHTVPKL